MLFKPAVADSEQRGMHYAIGPLHLERGKLDVRVNHLREPGHRAPLAERHTFSRHIQPCRTKTVDKADRCNRVLADEFLFDRVFSSGIDRRVRL